MRIRRSRWLLVGGLLAVGLVSACGSSGSKAGAGGSSGPSGSPIVIGSIGNYSGAQSSSTAGAVKVIKAWVDSVNASGGISGHPVKLVVKDDSTGAAASTQGIRELIDQDHVVAIVGHISSFAAIWGPIVSAAGIPVVGGQNEPQQLVDPNFFASGANRFALFYAMQEAAKANGDKLAVLYCAESPQCGQTAPVNKAISAGTGINVVYSTAISSSAPDYTSVCQAIKASGAQSVVIGANSSANIRVMDTCKQQGVNVKNTTFGGTVTADWPTHPSMEGTIAAQDVFPFFDGSTPATKAYQDAIAKYAPDLGNLNGPISLTPWVAGKLFEAAIKASGVGKGQVTAQTVKDGLYKLKNETLGGLTPPLNYTPGKVSLVNCAQMITITNGKFVVPSGSAKEICAPPDFINQIIASQK